MPAAEEEEEEKPKVDEVPAFPPPQVGLSNSSVTEYLIRESKSILKVNW